MKKLILILGLFCFTQCTSEKSQSGESRDYAKELKAGSAVGLDVRSAKELQTNPAPGALHIPIKSLSSRLKELDKNKTILVFCEVGGRASIAKGLLKIKGFKEVINIKDWRTWNKITNSGK